MKLPFVFQIKSSKSLWRFTENNKQVLHKQLFAISIIESNNVKALHFTLFKYAIAFKWLGFK